MCFIRYSEDSMNRKWYIIFAFLLVASLSFGRSQFRLVGDASLDFVKKPSLSDVKLNFDNTADMMTGFHWEVITNSGVGFGNHYLVKFSRLLSTSEYIDYEWWLDWNGDAYLSFHFLGTGRLFDPFLEIGYGCVGRVQMITENEDYWVKDDEDQWYYDPPSWESDGSGGSTLQNISLYPYVGAGLAFDIRGLLLSAKGAYRPFVNPIPGTRFDNYPLKNFQVVLSAGFAFGGHRRHW